MAIQSQIFKNAEFMKIDLNPFWYSYLLRYQRTLEHPGFKMFWLSILGHIVWKGARNSEWSKIYSKVCKIIIWELDGISAAIISSTTNNRDSKDPYLYKVFHVCYNYCYVKGVDSLQKISVQLCCRGETEVSHFHFHKKRIITLNTSQIRKRWCKDFDLSYIL